MSSQNTLTAHSLAVMEEPPKPPRRSHKKSKQVEKSKYTGPKLALSVDTGLDLSQPDLINDVPDDIATPRSAREKTRDPEVYKHRVPVSAREEPPFYKTRIYRAIRKGDATRLLKALQKENENALRSDPDNGCGFYHLAVQVASPTTEDRFLPMVYQLSNAGAVADQLDWRGRTPLQMAIVKELRGMMVALIRVGADLGQQDYRGLIKSLQSPLQQILLEDLDYFQPGLWQAVSKNQVLARHIESDTI